MARQLSRDPATALDVHVREELGLDPGDLPSATLAAGSSFLSFAVGAFLPVLPYLLGATGMLPAVLLTVAGLFLCGAFVTQLTPRPWWYGGGRQVAVGAVAGVTPWSARPTPESAPAVGSAAGRHVSTSGAIQVGRLANIAPKRIR